MRPSAAFHCEPDPAHPGWLTWDLTDTTRFNGQVMGKLIVRREGDRGCRVRMLETLQRHGNLHDNVHGGVTLALIDIAMFAAAFNVLGADAAGSVTLDLNCQFIGAGRLGQPLDAATEILKETRRLIFVRGLIEQDEALVASFSGTIRKPSQR
ncbi:PaaI family thioesterase [Novosphingobium album (ex Liu et al. 2023)]|uniref:PaaI family thioesterase n=1 Tax=Novosphingobium album (ex Liu et al. 2023) TaxID=3031130 RepID=A0ABT5WUJ5_9SPHN|nr:PaaI family thioesterase [Novosphingobium album (ex Liu et al. 2023)]MDE8653528.1 PaaI family thioesterase [Novosphingobium album (ex Liu et al. 2023)]